MAERRILFRQRVFYRRYCKKYLKYLTPRDIEEHGCFRKGKNKKSPCVLMQRVPC